MTESLIERYWFEIIISCTILLIILLGFSIFLAIHKQKVACEKVHGIYNGANCRIGNEFFEIYPEDDSFFSNYIVNKYPKTEG